MENFNCHKKTENNTRVYIILLSIWTIYLAFTHLFGLFGRIHQFHYVYD